MDIKILDSHLREYLKTKATPKLIAEKMSLASVSIERIHAVGDDFLYDIEVTTNRPDMASVVGIAREAGAVLPQAGIEAEFLPPKFSEHSIQNSNSQTLITVHNLDKYIFRVYGIVMNVSVKKTPEHIVKRLDAAGIRSLNNLIDITNYIMLTLGQPTHVFDFDRLQTDVLTLRESKAGEKITTLDGKTFTLPGGDLVADNGKEIVDLLGIMGLENSVVSEKTKRVLFFIDENDRHKIRKTSMALGIRTEAAQLNEKGIDPYLAETAAQMAVSLYSEIAEATVLQTFDIFPNPPKPERITVSEEKVNSVIGINIPIKTAVQILTDLGFQTEAHGSMLEAIPPTFRLGDVAISEDLIEEIARVFGYHNIPNALPPLDGVTAHPYGHDEFYWENHIKQQLNYYGFTEMYTYSMIPEVMYEGPFEESVKIKNQLTEDFAVMRNTLIPSLLQVLKENKTRDVISIFEIANVYIRKKDSLPEEKRIFAGIMKKPKLSFFEVKGVLEQIFRTVGVRSIIWKQSTHGGNGASIFIRDEYLGDVEILSNDVVDFELSFEILVKHATRKISYTPLSKYPAIIEDLSFVIDESVPTADIIEEIKEQSPLIDSVTLLDRYQNSRTFHITYLNREKNLTNEDAGEIRKRIITALQKNFKAKIKT